MKKSGSEILVETLIEEGVDSVFGFPGGSVIALTDTFLKYKDKINFYLVRHEQAAAHALPAAPPVGLIEPLREQDLVVADVGSGQGGAGHAVHQRRPSS